MLETGNLRIVILERGWVVLGLLNSDSHGDWFFLEKGCVVRRWGTDAGIGQLAMHGVRSETILDPLPMTKFHKDKIIQILDCDESKWQDYLSK